MSDISRWLSSLPAEWTEGCSGAVFESAYASYQSPGRFYHTWSHVTACVDKLRTFPCDSGRAVFLALLFHDAIYVPGRRDNERKSADLASQLLSQHSTLDEKEVSEVHRMVVATSDHQVEDSEQSRDLRATIDIDMSILGAPWAQYAAYAAGVRNEYCPAVTTTSRFTVGRIAFLSKVLASRAIFHTPEGIARWERAARDNVSREIRELRSQQSPLWSAVTAALGFIQKR